MKLRVISFALCILCVLSLFSGCGKREMEPPSLDERMEERVFDLSWEAEECAVTVSLSPEACDGVKELIDSVDNEYPYSHLYETDKAMERLSFDCSVDSHACSALDSDGKLTVSHMADTVCENNEAFLLAKPFGYEDVDRDYIEDICSLIIETVNAMLEKHPDIDRQRVYCNLGNLKILYDTGMLDFAQVTDKWVLAVNNLTASMAQTLKGEGAYRNTIMHETMHLIQIGCQCESIGEAAGRRCGICVHWEDWEMNSADWGWFFEASAERCASSLANTDPMTYTYLIDYLSSFNMAAILDGDNAADRMETVCFYSDPEILFSAFNCESEEERRELINAIISVNVLQNSPDAFFEAYKKEYGARPDADEEKLELFRYSLKPSVAVTLTKHYYKSLVDLLGEREIPLNDLFFLINAFESQLNQHLSYDMDKISDINEHFFVRYLSVRNALFCALNSSVEGLDAAAEYEKYDMCALGKTKLNATLDFLSEEKRFFFLERCQWHYGLLKLGVKVGESYGNTN